MGAKAGETVAETMKSFIRWLSNKCARQPCLVVGVMVFVSLLGASGLANAEFESDGYKLWASSRAARESQSVAFRCPPGDPANRLARPARAPGAPRARVRALA